MRATHVLSLTCMLLSAGASGAAAQQSELNAAVMAKTAEVEQQRTEVRQLLARPEVARVAATAGLDLERAQGAAGTLSATEVQRIAPMARTVNAHIAAGQVLTITTTTIIIVLLLLILIVLIA
jgi:hypothetical protein